MTHAFATRSEEQGFTLLEVMIALAVLAIAASGLMSVTGESLRRQSALEAKTFAVWVAENRMAEIRSARNWPSPGASTDAVAMNERRWRVATAIIPSLRPDMRKVTIDVFEENAASPLYTLTGYLGQN